MKEQKAANILSTTIEKVRELVDVSTVIGEPINLPDGTVIIPVSKVTYGFASGGSDFPSKNNVELFGGGGGAGVTINPVAFLVVREGEVSVRQISGLNNPAERVINLVPEMLDKVSGFVSKIKQDAPETTETPKKEPESK
ncbi:MAG: putative spore protein YtfJ [Firmicutes bacterium ADurb.Bin300]|jgi:sporulation protein YtfJ|nr:MAG: putative spore protein YtfJ [Firmicutes bacterium ADurb.Bin300]HOD02983.1 GerW family sporulation protein [Clostridiales bacterium]